MPTIYQLPAEPILPHPRLTEDPRGLLAVGGDLSVTRLLRAYGAGIFPWFDEKDPCLWWCPPERAIFPPHTERFSRRTQRALRTLPFEIRMDTAFEEVVLACRRAWRRGQHGTWITPDVVDAYLALHREGYAHSVETWLEGRLVGGLYGISLGAMFCGESMFASTDYASRAAFQALCHHCWTWGFHFIDGQLPNENLMGLGATVIPRQDFLDRLEVAMEEPTRRGPWTALCDTP